MPWELIVNGVLVAFAALVGAALGAWLQHRFDRNRDHLETKRDVLRRVMGHRWQFTEGGDPFRENCLVAFNEIPVVFAGDKRVEEAFSKFRMSWNGSRYDTGLLENLAVAMAKAASVPHCKWDRDMVLKPISNH